MSPKVGNIYLSYKGTLFKIADVHEATIEIHNMTSDIMVQHKIKTFEHWYKSGQCVYLGTEVSQLAKALYG